METNSQTREYTVDELASIILEDFKGINESGTKNISLVYFWSRPNIQKVLPELMKYEFNFEVSPCNDNRFKQLSIKF